MKRVLLIHSGGFTSRQWRRLGEALAGRYEVLAPDLLGYGTSGAWEEGKAFHFRQDLEHLESLLSDDARRIDVVGHSYGGFLALQLALARPQLVRSIAVYEPVAFGALDRAADREALAQLEGVRTAWEPDSSGGDEAWLREFVEWWNGVGSWAKLPEETRTAFRNVGWKLFQEVMTLGADRTTKEQYGSIAVPTLLMAGARTPHAEFQTVTRLGEALPRATVRIFETAGHMGPISHATEVNEAIVAFLDSVED